MQLTIDNYHSTDANKAFMSVSQFKAFQDCPARAVALLNGTFEDDAESQALAIGSLVDAHLLTPDRVPHVLKAYQPVFYRKERKSKANPDPGYSDETTAAYDQAMLMVERAKQDELFRKALAGDHQTIITFDLHGVEWKVMLDVLDAETKTFTDLKTTGELSRTTYSAELRIHVPFYEAWGYWLQFAVYGEAFKAKFGEYPQARFMAAVTKETPPDLAIYSFQDGDRFDRELMKVGEALPAFIDMKTGKVEPTRCNKCDYCRKTKQLGVNADLPHGIRNAENLLPRGREV